MSLLPHLKKFLLQGKCCSKFVIMSATFFPLLKDILVFISFQYVLCKIDLDSVFKMLLRTLLHGHAWQCNAIFTCNTLGSIMQYLPAIHEWYNVFLT